MQDLKTFFFFFISYRNSASFSQGWMLKHQHFVLLWASHKQPLLGDESHFINNPSFPVSLTICLNTKNLLNPSGKYHIFCKKMHILQKMSMNGCNININSLLLYFWTSSFKSGLRHFFHWLANYCPISLNVITFLSLQYQVFCLQHLHKFQGLQVPGMLFTYNSGWVL